MPDQSPSSTGQPPLRSLPAGLVMLTQPHSPAAEAYRSLRVNLKFASLDQPLRTIVVTSAGAGDGKTTTLANLALATAEGGSRVLAVDADLRRPALHRLFNLDNRAGLTTGLLKESLPLVLHDTAAPGLRVLTSGPLPPNPAELLASRRLEQLLGALREQADFIFLDSPPAAALADAATLAARADGVILVVDSGRTRRDLAQRAKAQLERVNARLLGVVLAGAPAAETLYAY